MDHNDLAVALSSDLEDQKVKLAFDAMDIDEILDFLKNDEPEKTKEARKLTYEARKQLPKSTFVFPKDERYPIPDESHARNALARSSGKPEESKVRAAVHAKFPNIGKEKKSSVQPLEKIALGPGLVGTLAGKAMHAATATGLGRRMAVGAGVGAVAGGAKHMMSQNPQGSLAGSMAGGAAVGGLAGAAAKPIAQGVAGMNNAAGRYMGGALTREAKLTGNAAAQGVGMSAAKARGAAYQQAQQAARSSAATKNPVIPKTETGPGRQAGPQLPKGGRMISTQEYHAYANKLPNDTGGAATPATVRTNNMRVPARAPGAATSAAPAPASGPVTGLMTGQVMRNPAYPTAGFRSGHTGTVNPNPGPITMNSKRPPVAPVKRPAATMVSRPPAMR